MIRLHLLRHAEPLVFGSFSSDKERTLADPGKKQCEILKKYLDLDWSKINIWCSTAIRTRETALNVIPGSTFQEVQFKEELYHASMSTLLELISSFDKSNELMIIGHNNGLTDLLNYLSDNETVMQTGHYVCLEFPLDHWNEVSRSIASVVRECVP